MALIRGDVPVIPDGDEAREWAERELSRPEYAAAEPTPLDRIAQAVRDFFVSLFSNEAPPGVGNAILIGVAALAIVLIVIAFLVWGRPRAIRQSAPAFAPLFGDDDARSAAQLRIDAAGRAREGEWAEAIVLRFRALARGLLERGVVDLPPGATVHAFARASGRTFPAQASAVDAAADAFDDVRYLRRTGTAELYDLVTAADDALVSARPDADARNRLLEGAPR